MLTIDVLDRFRSMCLEFYGLYHCYFFSNPGLNWSSMLKMVGSKFELISSVDMYLGIFYIAQRYNKANIK